MKTETKLIKNKLGLLNLAEELGNVYQSMQVPWIQPGYILSLQGSV